MSSQAPSAEQRLMAGVIADRPWLTLFGAYTTWFYGASVGRDLVSFIGGRTWLDPYLFSVPMAVVFWLGLRSWSKRVARRDTERPPS